jgi:hypothetical protein
METVLFECLSSQEQSKQPGSPAVSLEFRSPALRCDSNGLQYYRSQHMVNEPLQRKFELESLFFFLGLERLIQSPL